MSGLPTFSKESLEELLIAVCHLKDEQGRALCVNPIDVLHKDVLDQLPMFALNLIEGRRGHGKKQAKEKS